MVYNYFFDLEMVAEDVDDFVSTLEKILQLCDSWCERIDAKLWHYRPREYKTEHIESDKIISCGPKAIAPASG